MKPSGKVIILIFRGTYIRKGPDCFINGFQVLNYVI